LREVRSAGFLKKNRNFEEVDFSKAKRDIAEIYKVFRDGIYDN